MLKHKQSDLLVMEPRQSSQRDRVLDLSLSNSDEAPEKGPRVCFKLRTISSVLGCILLLLVLAVLPLALSKGSILRLVPASSSVIPNIFNREQAAFSTHRNFAGVNSMYLWGLADEDRHEHLQLLSEAGVKVIRVFLLPVQRGAKGSSIPEIVGIEPYGSKFGEYNDTSLEMVDKLMYEAWTWYRIKLNIALGDRHSLNCWKPDRYASDFPQIQCDDPTYFYKDATVTEQYAARIRHVMRHRNPYLGNKTWGDSSMEAIAMISPQNEQQGGNTFPGAPYNYNNDSWLCTMAKVVRDELIGDGILISSGGGGNFQESIRAETLNCPNVDILALHDYDGYPEDLFHYSKQALDAADGTKRIIWEEFGSSRRNDERYYSELMLNASAHGFPIFPWEFLRCHDAFTDGQYNYEFYNTSDPRFSGPYKAMKSVIPNLPSNSPW
eukprot:CAMPEP_0170187706 /NCGR_PEP_ID=MMETSP0040_2-20121228/42373_1 /TAXON_ID=641309 /ORGANISM="Lotharella oceanica, Strain CCMP622" /LENGTH=437 /DNA_ID=CAMNT_0010434805 /DNA_START=85 /DNA_END=1395 /DNA_ORIENTATION=-